MKIIKTLSKLPIIGTGVRHLIKVRANMEAKQIANHFSQYFSPILCQDDSEKSRAFRIRHKVYCEELKFEPEKEDKLETDDVDKHSLHCLIQHKNTKEFAGTVRVVCSNNPEELLPIEKYCMESIDHPTLNPSCFPRDTICEISRLAVPDEFRRRQSDKFDGAATGAINEQVYSEKELRCFPFIAVGLYLSAASILIEKALVNCFVMMEPRLARSLSFVGIKFEKIGPVVDYHGKRAPYYIDPRSLKTSLTPGFLLLMNNIGSAILKVNRKRK